MIRDYATHAQYIAAIAASISEVWKQQTHIDYLLFSFHSIPQRYADKGDPYESFVSHQQRRLQDIYNYQREVVGRFPIAIGLQQMERLRIRKPHWKN